MTIPESSGAKPKQNKMLSLVEPFDGLSSQGSGSSNRCTSPRSTLTIWSLWPLKMQSTSATHASTPTSFDSPSLSANRNGTAYPNSFSSSSPPSSSGAGNDSSPPSTPPDYANSISYTGNFSLDGRNSASKSDRQQLSPQSSPISVTTSPSSRNNIFSSPVVSPIPAPRLQTKSLEVGTFAKSRNGSKNAGFFDSPISQVTSAPQSAMSRVSMGDTWQGGDPDRPNYGRANTEERERERARIRKNNTEVDFRLCPVKDHMLGEGRHCNVYLGSYRTKCTAKTKSTEKGYTATHDWKLCAIKRLHADRQSQLLGLEEAFAMRRLGSHPNIVGLISIRDEVELTATLPSASIRESSWSGVPVSLNRDQRGEMQYNHIGKGVSPGFATMSHWRSVSDTQATEWTGSDSKDLQRRTQTHRRQVSTPTKGPIVMVASPEGDEIYASPIASSESSSSSRRQSASELSANTVDPPRLLIMLELLPYSLSSFAKRNPDQIDFDQWKEWALELTSVVEWLHNKGCVHADLKPENVLLTSDLTVKLCDFNSALFPSPQTTLTDGLGLGTPAYGAPELASRSSKGFSYPVDIWSLGAILYTLAVGVEPFRKARSMIDILYRKGHFFESEENDRIAFLCVEEGRATSVNGGSTTASRNGSVRSKKGRDSDMSSSTSRPTATLRREMSSESVSSIASSVMLSGSSSGRVPSVRAINMLLEPSSPIGVILPPGIQSSSSTSSSSLQHFKFGNHGTSSASNGVFRSSSVHGSNHHRATSLGKGQNSSPLLSPDSARKRNYISRPSAFRRSSYGDEQDVDGVEEPNSPQHNTTAPSEDVVERRNSSNRSSTDSNSLRLAVTAAFAQSKLLEEEEEQKRRDQEQADIKEEANLSKPYKDGSPALILPGGGRLPDEARNLLERMLSTDASRRPTAMQVKGMLEAL